MSSCTYQTALRLKECGLLQPLPKSGQIWHGKKSAGLSSEAGSTCVLVGSDTGNMEFVSIDGKKNDNNKFFVFLPDAEYITALLPPGWALEMWDGKPSCTNRDDEFPIRVWGDNFAEAAAGMWLEVNALKAKLVEIIEMAEEKTRQLPK